MCLPASLGYIPVSGPAVTHRERADRGALVRSCIYCPWSNAPSGAKSAPLLGAPERMHELRAGFELNVTTAVA